MHECMKDAVRVLVGLVEEVEGMGEEEYGQGDSQRREGGGEQCVAVLSPHTRTHKYSDPRRRETVAQPGEM